MILTGNSLGERQKQLNEAVNKAATEIAFAKDDTDIEENDVDKICMIDLAAKYKNIDYILETLKTGDIVHITRALNKCTWLGEDEFANIVNVNNLQVNIFPFMSIKMKNKLLCMLARVTKNENRSIVFYEYCMKEKLFKIAMKFLFNTPETFKQEVILQKSTAFKMLLSNQEEAMANFIGNSFTLAQTLLDNMNGWNRGDLLDLLQYMYSVSSGQYLDMLEKYKTIDCRRPDPMRYGRRLSRKIIQKHKDRVLKIPLLYVSLLNKDKVIKNSTISDVKVYAMALLPDDASTFWNISFYEKYKFILDVIPVNERYSFIKEIFSNKYPDEIFEMSKQFYYRNFYNTMTIPELEDWALRHIESGDEIFGCGNDYNWYKFVRFEKAFEQIKKFIHITPESDKRMEIVNVLIDSVKTQSDLETLLNYYYNRHVNEQSHHKMRFLDTIIEKHKVFDFSEECWKAFEKILYSLDVFNISNYNYSGGNYRAIAVIYYIIQGKTVPAVLHEFIDKDIIKTYEVKNCSRDLVPEQTQMVFQYLLKFYLTAVKDLASKEYSEEVKTSIDRYIQNYLDLLHSYSKTKDDIPDIIYKFIKLNWNKFKYHRILAESGKVDFSEINIMQYMKKDAALVIDEFPMIKQYIQDRYGRTNWLIRKLKIYFHHDVAQKYVTILNDCLAADDVHYRMAQVGVYGILKLADESFKIAFVQKYVPTNPKIDHANISQKLLNIQKAICGYACVSRPPLPLSSVLQYLTGDYVHSCLPMFNSYLMNLPLSACIKFVESIIDKPLSIQKHGLRLAFQCFSTENLKSLINDVWKRTKNVSMRKILYKSLFDKVLKESDQTQLELFEVLNTLTLTLHQDDDEELFLLLSNRKLPNHLRGQHLVSGWNTVKILPERSVNFERMTRVIKEIENNLNSVPENELVIIMSDHVSKMLDERQILNTGSKKGLDELLKAKWGLTLRYLTNIYNEKQLKKNLEVVENIVKKCIEMWNEVSMGKYVMREFFRSFIADLQAKSYNHHKTESYPYMKIIYATILKDLQESLPEYEIFTLTLQLRLSDITRDIIIAGKQEFYNTNTEIAVAIRAALLRFAEAFVLLLRQYLDDGKYFATFNHLVDNYVTKELSRVDRNIDVNFKLNLKPDDLSVLLCASLLKFEMPEVYLLILRFLPLNYKGTFFLDYEKTINIVKAFKNVEVQYFMFEKFVNSDFVFRSDMLSKTGLIKFSDR